MKKLLLAIALLASVSANSQHLLSLNFGPSSPIGEFSNTSLLSEKAGYATNGYNLDFSYGYVWKCRIGMNIGVNYSSIPLDEYELNKLMEYYYGGDAMTTMENYELTSLKFGPVFSLGGKVRIDLNPTIGFLSAKIGNMDCMTDSDETYFLQQDGSKSNSITLGMNTKLRIQLCKILDLTISGVYSYAEPSFTIYDTYGETNYKQPMSMIQTNIGILFKIK
jgi:hypothetical protein